MSWKVLALVFACLLVAPPWPAQGANAELNAEIPAGKSRALRLRQLPKDASLGLRIESSGPIRVILVHQDGLRRAPDRPRPVFAGAAERRLTFRVVIPLAGTYYVILDNRKGAEAREVRIFIDARAGRPRAPARPPQKERPAPGLNAT